MTWSDFHQRSEALASEAFLAVRAGQVDQATALYAQAAEAEERALHALEPSKVRTLGITAVSAASLWFKAREYQRAERLIFTMLELTRFRGRFAAWVTSGYPQARARAPDTPPSARACG
jgi:hypothetical protein